MPYRIKPITAVTAMAAPLFLSSDDRGYLSTAMVTTPLVFAGQHFLPGLFDRSEEGRGIAEVFTKFQRPNSSMMNIKDTLNMGVSQSKRGFNLEQEQAQLRKLSKRFFVYPSMMDDHEKAFRDWKAAPEKSGKRNLVEKKWKIIQQARDRQDAKRMLLSNAVQRAALDAASTEEWANLMQSISQNPDPSYFNQAKRMSNDAMLQQIEKFGFSAERSEASRGAFVRSLNNQLRTIGIGTDKNGFAGTLVDPVMNNLQAKRGWSYTPTGTSVKLDFSNEASSVFEQENPETAKYLKEYMRRKGIDKLTARAELHTDGTLGKITSIDIGHYKAKGQRHMLSIPVVDKAGRVRLNDSLVGVGRHIVGEDLNPYRIDTWMARLLAKNKFSEADIAGELKRGVYFSDFDPTDIFKMEHRASVNLAGAPTLADRQIGLRSKVAVVSDLPIYGLEGNQKYADLEAAELTRHAKRVYNTNQYAIMTSEGGLVDGTYALRELANVHPLGAPNVLKQDATYRAFSKGYWLKANDSALLSGELRPRYVSDSLTKLVGTEVMPEAAGRIASIAPEHRNLFAQLPDTLEELQNSRKEVVSRFVTAGLQHQDAVEMVNGIEKTYEIGRQDIFKGFGRLGETDFMANEDWANNFSVENISRYEVNDPRGVPMVEGAEVDRNSVLGWMDRNIVRPDNPGVVESVVQIEKNTFDVRVRHSLGMSGAKVDIAGIKGLMHTVDAQTFEDAKGFMNLFYEKAGIKDRIGENVHMMVDQAYFANKAESAQVELSLGGDLAKILQEEGQKDLLAQYQSALSSRVKDIDVTANGLRVLENPSDLNAAADRMVELARVNQEFFAQAGEALRKANVQNSTLKGFLESGSGNLYNYMLKNSMVAPVRAWSHTGTEVSRTYSITHDMESLMAAHGQYEGLKAIMSRQRFYSGDREMMLGFGKALATESYKNELGATYDLKSLSQVPVGSLTYAENRKGTIFDPSLDAYKQNYRIDLGEAAGARHRYVPVPGSEAFGASSPMIGKGEYQTHDWQRKLREVLHEGDVTKRDALIDALHQEYTNIFIGKNGAFRASAYDPDAATGFLRAHSEGGLFDVQVSPEVVRRMRSPRVRKQLLANGEAYGTLFRQPISATPHVRIRMNNNLKGGYNIAAQEWTARTLEGDIDRDPMGLSVYEPGSAAEAEAKEFISSGRQRKWLEEWMKSSGTKDVAAFAKDTPLVEGVARAEKFAKSIHDADGVIASRLVGRSIGAYSNMLDSAYEHLAASAMDSGQATRLSTHLYKLRQFPITAQKQAGTMDLEHAIKNLAQLNQHFRTGNGFEFHRTMQNIASQVGDEDWMNYLKTEESSKDVTAMMAAKTPEASVISDIYHSRLVKDGEISEELLATVRKAMTDPDRYRGLAHGGSRMATETAGMTGAINEAISSAKRAGKETQYAYKAFTQAHGKTAALALGGLAMAGILLGGRKAPVASFANRPSSAGYRPDEAIGVNDRIPGEAVAGSMSSNPPRRMLPAPRGVSTAVVAPMGNATDIEVRTRAKDRADAAEKSKLASFFSNRGHQTTNITYRGDSKLDTLRMRDKIRQMRDQ